MSKRYKVAVVDDHPIFRRGVAETFDEAEDFEVIAEGASAKDATAIARDKRADVYLLDVSMPGDGIQATRDILRLRPESIIVLLTIREELAVVQAGLAAGARGYILKGIDGNDLLAAVRKATAGQGYVTPELAAKLLMDLNHRAAPAAVQDHSILTDREKQIVALLQAGHSNREIAEKLGLRENTIKHYMTPLLQKLGVRNRTEAALLARDAKD